MKGLAIVLIVAGAIMMIITGVNFATKKVVDLGKVEISKTEDHPISWSPIVGGVLLVAGIGILLVSKKKAM